MRTLALALVLAAALLAGCKKAEPPRAFSQAALDQALADPARKDQRDAADARRKPGPLIALAGVKPGDKVLDLIPGSGYWTRIFSQDRRAGGQGLCGLAAGLCARRDGQRRGPEEAFGRPLLREYRHRGAAERRP